MADSKTTTTKTIAGGTLTTSSISMANYGYSRSSGEYANQFGFSTGEYANQFGFAAIKKDGSVVAWGTGNTSVPNSLNGAIDTVQIYSNTNSFVALRNDGSVVPLGYQNITSAALKQLDGTVDVTQVYSTNAAFAAVRLDGSVVTWGDNKFGGDSNSVAKQLDGNTDVTHISSTNAAFAAVRKDGSVITWGDSSFGGNSNTVAKEIDGTTDITQIYSNYGAFAAVRADGSVITWGDSYNGGDSSSVAKQLDGTTDVSQIYSNYGAFAAVLSDGSVITWGNASNGGNSSAVAKQLDGTIDVSQIFSNYGAFAAIRADGSVVTWGNNSYGGDSSAVAKQLDGTIDIKQIYSTGSAFAALRADGSVVTWGYGGNSWYGNGGGGNSSAVAKQIDGTIDVVSISSTYGAFAAIRADGSVVTWGDSYYAGDSSSAAKQLDGTIDVIKIYANNEMFAALRADGSVISWDDYTDNYTARQLDGTIDVTEIHATNEAFTALRGDGSVVTWGESWYGADSSSVSNQLTSNVETFADITLDDFYTAADSTPYIPVHVNNLPTGTISINGTTTEDETLSISDKVADADGLGEMNYQWLRDGAAVIGAVQPSYILSQMDVGKKISVAAYYTDSWGTHESMVSGTTQSIQNLNQLPTGKVSISGTTAKGQTLTVSDTLDDFDGMGIVSYQWLREGTPIPKATDSTYTLSASDMFKTVSVKASYKDLQGTNESVRSAETSKIAAPINHAPTGTVLIHGELLQNQTLSVTNNLADVDGINGNIGYQWVINGTPVQGATKSTYLLTQADVYKTVSVIASYTDKLGKVESVAGGVVQNENDKPIGNVVINGTVRVDETLTIQNNISDIDGMSGDFQYEWKADGEAFAEGEALTLTKEQLGKAISVAVQYTDNGGTFESVLSSETRNVIPQNSLPTGYVMVLGDTKVGEELSAFSTIADVDGLGKFDYQWYSSDTPIKDATSDSYKLELGDVGERISVNVQYVDGYETLESVTSADSATIQPSYVNGLVINSSTDNKIIGSDKNDVLSALPKVNYSINASAGNDVVNGNSGNDILDGGKGDDKISGGKGNDKLIGGDGSDTLKGGVGADTMQGGDGNDYYFIDDVKDVVTESNKNGRLGGNDTIESTLSYTLDKNIENLVLAGDKKIDGTGNEFANQISGNTAENVLTGNAGNDDISGGKGADTLFGGDGEDVLDGGEGTDILNGDAGDDFLSGGEGSDSLNGGDGQDVAIFNSVQTDYQISRTTTGSVQMSVKYIGKGINEGTDSLNGIEMLKFGDDEVVNVSDVVDTVITVVGVIS